MRWSTTPFVLAFAAPLVLASSSALAAGADSCFLTSAQSCEYVLSSGGCETKCSPGNFVVACDASCTGSAQVSCTGSCEADCSTKCTQNPPVDFCVTQCGVDCDAGCEAHCNDSACTADCHLDCENRCQVSCVQLPPTATCTETCKTSCDASCTVQENIMCHAGCTASGELPSCQTACQSPNGALFCDGQYIDLEKAAQDCIDYLESQGVTVSSSCTATASGSSCTSTVTCSAAPALGAGDRWGLFGMTGLLTALGLVVSRRRSRWGAHAAPQAPRR